MGSASVAAGDDEDDDEDAVSTFTTCAEAEFASAEAGAVGMSPFPEDEVEDEAGAMGNAPADMNERGIADAEDEGGEEFACAGPEAGAGMIETEDEACAEAEFAEDEAPACAEAFGCAEPSAENMISV